MVEEQRMQIGTMKALGYTRWSIAGKYLGYGLLPSLVGGIVGLGPWLYPVPEDDFHRLSDYV